MGAFQDLYLALPSSAKGLSQPQRLLLRARHYELLQRPEAAGIYERLTELADDPAVQQDARFFLGRFYQRSGHLEKALVVLQGALGANPVRGWSSLIHLALGEVYESLGQPARALEEYHLTEKMSHDATVSQRMNSLLLALNQELQHKRI
jgi:tetratricopeptide (TPR) repeat protein